MKVLCQGLLCLGILTVLQNSSYAQEPKLYTIQLGAFPDEAAAAQLLADVSATTAPGFIRQDFETPATPHKVCVGRFRCYADAWAVKSVLPGTIAGGFITSFVPDQSDAAVPTENEIADSALNAAFLFVDIPESVPVVAASDPKELVSISVPEEETSLTSAVLEKPVPSMGRSELIAVGVKARDNNLGTGALGHFIKEYPNDTAKKAAHLRLARRLLYKKDFAGAKQQLDQLEHTATPEEKGKSALVRAYITMSENGSKSGYRAFSQVANREDLPANYRSNAMRMAAGSAHATNDHTTAVLAFNQIIKQSPVLEERLEARLQRCGLLFELVTRGKGTWPEVIDECNRLKGEESAPDFVKIGASLMEFEAHWFAKNYDQSYVLGKAFLQQWGEDPTVYDTRKVRQYINTARLFQMQNAYVTGKPAEALSLAANVLANPPAENEQYATGNTMLYACVIGALTAQQSGNGVQAAEFETKGREFNDAYFSMLTKTMEDLKTKYAQ